MRIRSLHTDERGIVASAELILAGPIFLLFWVLLWDFGILQSAKLALLSSNRTAAFLEAKHGICAGSGKQQEAVAGKTTYGAPACSKKNWNGASKFWSEMDNEGGQSLTGDVRNAKAPRIITARQQAVFRFHPELEWADYRIPDRFVVMEEVTYTNDDPALTAGYDKVLKQRLSSGHGQLIDLFPNVFPGAR
jgi:hypothetical protein